MIRCRLQFRWYAPKQPLRPRRGIEGRLIVPGQEARLQLSDPVPALALRPCRVTRQMALELKLIKLLIIEGAEFRGQATEGSDKPELYCDEVNGEAKPSLSRKLEAMLGFMLHLP